MQSRQITIPRGQAPLPVKEGLNPSRVRIGPEFAGATAFDFVWHLISSQRYRADDDNEAAVAARFARGEVVIVSGMKGLVAEPHDTLPEGLDLWFYRTPVPEPEVPYSPEVIFEDDNLLVVDKPPFMSTMPRGKHITQTVTVHMRRVTGNGELSPAHRLDRLTSGVLVMTKHRGVRGAYQELFARKQAQKTYTAIAAYEEALAEGALWRDRMVKNSGTMQAEIVAGEPNAETELVGVDKLDRKEQDRLENLHGPQPLLGVYWLKPHTGKTHQLRLHMNAAGVPILGDPIYPTVLPESAENFLKPLHLCAHSLEFTDPITNQKRHFTALRRF